MAVFARRIRKSSQVERGPGPEERLDRGLLALEVELPEGAREHLLALVRLLAKWNRVYNLTSVRKPADMVGRHLLDSLSVLPHLRGPRVLDIGTGAGLPGLVLAIARPDWQLVLLDASNKKLRFVRQAVAELTLDNVEVVHCRVEDYRPDEVFDSVVSRAYSSLEEMYQAGHRLCRPDGRIHAMKGVFPVAEMDALSRPGVVERVERLQVPGLDAERHLVIMRPEADAE
ncbi:16S rRNA (guanine(527)-N(7))-methyltransferase RsmG [Thiohalobacter sp.]|uniref:16S rRNA (guanine(527)-N(7))-methyltransferase RsmG n=1 Tax=Thiohalobacter sp. TaxID=2025948 RepID=UPI0026390345|nr:16S rRNA (guanine(527)-N(7))-methyltransferase RsmG [Thiohalobacter sp.]